MVYYFDMNKSEAISIHGATETDLANALGFTKQYINQWPDDLSQKQIDWVIGAAIRLGKKIPRKFIPKPEGQAA